MKLKRGFLYMLSAFLLLVTVCFAKNSIAAAQNAIFICGQTVIPSLFPFFILSSFMIHTGFVACMGKLLSPVAKRLFRISGGGAVVFVIGILCGYPTGAKMVSELYEKKLIDRNEAMRLLPFCNNSGPLFVIGAVGVGMLQNIKLGQLLYAIHVLSAVLVGLFSSFFAKGTSIQKMQPLMTIRFGEALSTSVTHSVKTMLEVCGFIILFAVLKSFCKPLLFCIFGDTIYVKLFLALMEVSIGAYDVCVSGLPFQLMFILLSGVIGFGGFCVMFQVLGILSQSGISIKTYVTGKIFQMVLSMGITAFVVNIWSIQPAFFNFADLSQKYLSVAPYFLFAFFFACAYAFSIKRN